MPFDSREYDDWDIFACMRVDPEMRYTADNDGEFSDIDEIEFTEYSNKDDEGFKPCSVPCNHIACGPHYE